MSAEARPIDSPASTKSQATSSKSQAQSFVERQLEQTSSLVRFNDTLATIFGGLAWIALVLFAAILIDAWVVPLTPTWRWIFLLGLIGGWAGFTGWQLFPVFFRRINPTFTARMIESTTDEFHNSIVNYTFLQDDKNEINPHVVQAVSQKAANDLAKVSGSERIDRSNLIRFGLALVVLTGIIVAYAMLSPKSPWQTVARVFSPLSELTRPSSVTIDNVQPGNTEVFFGRKLLVTANVKGKHDPDSVTLVFSTADKRLTDVRQIMRPAEGDSLQYQAELTTSPQGIDSSLTYRIEAGDGRTLDFEVKVNANPTIAVNNVVITSPPYTKIPERSFTSAADLSGPEGAKVKVFALANLPIKVAAIELLAQTESAGGQPSYSLVTSIPMAVTENSAVGEFTLYFDRRANKPDFTHFQLKFTSSTGDRNEIANVYPIRIILDLGPEIRLTNPKEKEVRVPVNHSLPVALIANDLDYELQQVQLVVDHRGVTALKHEFVLPETGDRQILSGKYSLRPEDLKLKPGDEILFYAKATDNRHSSVNGLLESNEARTDNYRLIVGPPSSEPDPQPEEPDSPPDAENKDDSQQEEASKDPENTNDQTNNETGDSQESGSENSSTKGKSEKSDEDESPKDQDDKESSNNNEKGQPDDQQNSGNSDSDKTGDKQNQKKQASKSGGNDKNTGDDKNKDSKDDKQGSEKGNPASGNQKSDQDESADSGSGKSDEQGGEKGNSSESADQPSDKTNGSQSKSNSKNGKGKTSDSKSNSEDGQRDESLTEGEDKPLDQDATDTERFEKLKKLMEKDQKQDKSEDKDPTKSPEGSKDENPPSKTAESSEDENSSKEKNDGKSGQTSASNSENKQSADEEDKSKEEKQKQGSAKSPSAKQGDSSDKPSAKSDNQSGNEPKNPKSGGESGGSKGNQKPKESGDSTPSSNADQNSPKSSEKSEANGSGNDSIGSEGKEDGNGPEKSTGNKGGKNADSKSSGQGKSKSEGTPQVDSESKAKPNSTDPSKSPAKNAGTGGGKDSGGIPDKPAPGSQKSKTGSDENRDADTSDTSAAEAEELKYKKETTDLVLKYLSEQQDSADREDLLRQLNMTDQQLKEFLQRWQAMADKAKSGDAVAAQQYERALRALGLRNRNAKIKGADARMENLSEGSAVSRPPAEFENAFLDYLKSLNRSAPANPKK